MYWLPTPISGSPPNNLAAAGWSLVLIIIIYYNVKRPLGLCVDLYFSVCTDFVSMCTDFYCLWFGLHGVFVFTLGCIVDY